MKFISRIIFLFLILTVQLQCSKRKGIAGAPVLESSLTDEVSGLITAAKNQEVLFVHNDSGDKSRFFAISTSGKLLSIINFEADPEGHWLNGVRDCEDIASGPGPDTTKNYIYLGDIGDNKKKRDYICIYRFEEPEVLKPEMAINADILFLRYPDGPRDAETLMVDPISKQIYIISKREKKVGIYSTPLLFSPNANKELIKRGTFAVSDKDYYRWITGGDVSQDGQKVVVRTYQKIYFWERKADETLEQLFLRKPVDIPCIPGYQSEAIGFTQNGKGVYCISEGSDSQIDLHPTP